MIKVNLAASISSGTFKAAKVSSAGGDEAFLGPEEVRKEALKRLVLLLAGPLALYVYETQNLPQKHVQFASKTQVLREIEAYNNKQAGSVAEIKKFKEDEALIEARISALEKISRDRSREIRVLDLLQTVMPEKAWLTKLQIFPKGINIQGLALSDFEVSSLLDALTKSVFLVDVNLVSSTEVNQDGVALKNFEISCSLERPQ